MNEKLLTTVQTIEERFEAQRKEFSGQVMLIVAADKIQEVCRTLRDEFGFEVLAAQTAVDYWPQEEPRFHIVYQFYSMQHNLRLGLRVPISGRTPVAPTIEVIYPNANWHEREIWDMFGIKFEGHSDMRRILMPEDWEGHPLRKDYPLGYEEVRFTFNDSDIGKRKPQPKE